MGEWESFEEMHKHYTQSFVNSEGFGMSRIVSFDEPSFRRMRIDDLAYSVEGLNLIGLKSNAPVIYESNWREVLRTKLETYPTRGLTAFEQSSLDEFYSGETLTWEFGEHRNTVKLVAALRATESCLECHQVSEGELLGAFVYHLQRTESLNELQQQPLK